RPRDPAHHPARSVGRTIRGQATVGRAALGRASLGRAALDGPPSRPATAAAVADRTVRGPAGPRWGLATVWGLPGPAAVLASDRGRWDHLRPDPPAGTPLPVSRPTGLAVSPYWPAVSPLLASGRDERTGIEGRPDEGDLAVLHVPPVDRRQRSSPGGVHVVP